MKGLSLKNIPTMQSDRAEDKDGKIRVLSYNFNLLPRGCSGFQSERIKTFMDCVDQYDVIMFQEVYAVSLLPYFIQKHCCFRTQLLNELRERGFSHYVMSRQPSYQTIIRHNVLSDNGLVIASRFPIGHHGSHTFCNKGLGEQSVSRGCIFAEVELPLPGVGGESERVVFFNVHLRPDESEAQVMEVSRFIESVMGQLHDDTNAVSGDPKQWCPFVVAGDFNINAVDVHSDGRLTKQLSDCMRELQPLGELRDVVFESEGSHPPTRPAKMFFQTQSKLSRCPNMPRRQDYFFATPSLKVLSASIQKFVASNKRPYVYLSDHFGVSATLGLSATACTSSRRSGAMPHSRMKVTLAGETVNAHSNPPSNSKMELAILPFFCAAAVYLNWPMFLGFGALWLLLWWSSSRIRVLSNERAFAAVTPGVVAGAEPVALHDAPREYDTLCGAATVAELWQRSVHRHRGLPCVGELNSAGKPEWLTYAAADAVVHDIGSGFRAIGVAPGDVIGVDCNARGRAVLLELSCAAYGFAALALAGKSAVVRGLIDEHKVKVVVADSAAVPALLSCRSRCLETIVCLRAAPDAADESAARDMGIALLSCDELERRGRLCPLPALSSALTGGDATLSLAVDSGSGSGGSGECVVTRMTHADALRNLRALAAARVLPDAAQSKELVVWFTPFADVFSRLFVLGLFAHGSAVGTAESASVAVFSAFRPTICVSHASFFAPIAAQVRRAKERYGRLYAWVFDMVYQFRSTLIHVHRRDSSLLRYLFFRGFRRQLGGNVHKIVLSSAEESVSFELEEFIAVCYTPCLREVNHLFPEGVVCIDGIPAPGLRVQLAPLDTPPMREANIGQLAVVREDGERRALPVAATWGNGRELRLVGPPGGILWPVGYECAVAAPLERTFAQSRYVNDIFLHADPLQPIVAIVSPNRDTVEFEWHQRPGADGEPLSWSALTRFAPELLLADFRRIADVHGLPETHVPQYVHLHPHAFGDHENLLTPHGRLLRGSIAHYFRSVLLHIGQKSSASLGEFPPPMTSASSSCSLSDDVSDEDKGPQREPHFRLHFPLAVDIGGTFAKVVFVQPPGSFTPPDYLIPEASSLSEKFCTRTMRFFADRSAAKEQLRANPTSRVGTVRFAKLASKRIPDVVTYLKEINALNNYTEPHRGCVRATGGGAFKYAKLLRDELNVNFDVVREMDAVVQGLNLVLRCAPESIFTVEASTGMAQPHKLPVSPTDGTLSPFPYLLVNIGSGISIIKCFGPDGKHVRVGGSPIGGATFWGLVRTMTNLTSWEEVTEVMRLDGPGDNRNIDLLVGDIYGYNAKDLPAMLSVDTVASTFGKCGTERFYKALNDTRLQHSFSSEDAEDLMLQSPVPSLLSPQSIRTNVKNDLSSIDIVRSLLNMISSNITQLAYLHGCVQNVQNVFFAGGFVRDNDIVQSLISKFMHYWSNGERLAHFLKHDGYLGALGSVTMQPEDEIQN